MCSSDLYIKKGRIVSDYSGFDLGEAEQLSLSADYTSSRIGIVGELDFEADYGKVSVTKAHIIRGNGDYVTLRFGTISKQLMVETDYGSFNVAHLLPLLVRSKLMQILLEFVLVLIQNGIFNLKLIYNTQDSKVILTSTFRKK